MRMLLGNLAVLATSVLVLLSGCEDRLPDAFQEQVFVLAEIDDRGCELLQRPLIQRDTLFSEPGVIDSIILDTLFVGVVAGHDSLAAVFDSLIVDSVSAGAAEIAATFDALASRFGMLTEDNSLLVTSVRPGGRAYATYSPSSISAGGLSIFYLNDFLQVELIGRNGTVSTPEGAGIPLELATACTDLETQEISPGVNRVLGYTPILKARFTFSPDADTYLVRFTGEEGAAGGAFRVAILRSDE